MTGLLLLLTSLAAVAADLRLAWDAVSGASGYTLHYGTSSRNYTAQLNTGAATSGTITGLSPGVTYYIAVTAVNSAGTRSGYSNEVSTTIPGADATAPSAPASLSATASGTTAANLAWSASTDNVGVTGYRVERCTGSGCTAFSQVATPTGTTWSNTGLATATIYRYRVRAVDAAGNQGAYSPIATVTTGSPADTAAPSVPANVAASRSGSTSINVSWSASSDNVGVTGYRLERCTGSSCTSFAEIGQPSSTSYANTGLATNTTYRYRVRARDAAGNLSGYSSIVSASTAAPADTQAPSVPSSVQAVRASSTSIRVSWSASSDNVGVTGYRIERCTGSSCTSYAQVATATGTSYTNTGLATNTTYRYRLRANDAAGNLSGYSSTATASTSNVDTTPPSVTPNVAALQNGSTKAYVTWSAATDNVGVDRYRVERCRGTTCTNFVQIADPRNRTYGDIGLLSNTTYRYRVRAADAAGNLGPYSAIASVRTKAASSSDELPAGVESIDDEMHLMVDEAADAHTVSNVNGIVEPGEKVLIVSPSDSDEAARVVSAQVSGPAGAEYVLKPIVATDDAVDCTTGARCYRLTVSSPERRPALRWMLTLTETLADGTTRQHSVHVGGSFPDVPSDAPGYGDIEALVHHNITLGFADGRFRPDGVVSRAQVAMFLARAVSGAEGDDAIVASGVADAAPYSCTSGGISRFADVAPNDAACRHVHLLAGNGVDLQSGCADTGTACVGDTTTRAAMAVMVAGAIAPGGDAGIPIAGTFTDSGAPRSYSCAQAGGSHFSDVEASQASCRHINYLWARGVIDGFGDGTFRSGSAVTRVQMAKFLANAFGLWIE